MADKFLSRSDAKQRILRLDVSPVAPDHESALVVTAEMARLTYFVSDASGVWHYATRDHDPLAVVAVGPNDTLAFPWSRRNGVAARNGVGIVVFKRSIHAHVGLYIDVVNLESVESGLPGAGPVEIPIEDLGLVGTGMDIWARFSDDELLIVLQGWVHGRIDLLSGQMPPEPQLIVLRCRVDHLVPEELANRDTWTVDRLDNGGFDLDARLENGHVWVAHRRRGEAVSCEIEYYNGQDDIVGLIVDNHANPLGRNPNALIGEYSPVVVVSFHLESRQQKIEAEDLPSIERPQLHSVNPIIVTGDRLHSVEVSVEHRGEVRHFIPRVVESSKWVIWWSQDRWLTHKIGDPQHMRWPLNLEEIAGSQYMVDVRGRRVSLATLASLQPVVLASYDHLVTDKVSRIAFIIEDDRSGAVVTDFYQIDVFTNQDESLQWEGRNILDIGHEDIQRASNLRGNTTQHPAEHTQFLPFLIDTQASFANEDRVKVRFGHSEGMSMTRNTLGGLLVGDQDLRVGLLAYVGMDDGGARVVFAPGVDPLPPRTGQPYKTFPPEIMVDSVAPGRAWAELRADDWIDSHLPGYFVPASDALLRRTPPPRNILERIALELKEQALSHFTPRSIGSGLQLSLDALPFLEVFTPGGTSTYDPDHLQPEVFELSQPTALAMQKKIAENARQSRAFRSGNESAFQTSFKYAPGMAQAEMEVTFTAEAPTTNTATFEWTFTLPQNPPISIERRETSPAIVFPIEGNWTVRMVATANDGSMSTINSSIPVAPSLWKQVWQAQRSISNDTVTVGSTTLVMSKFRIEYVMNAQGQPTLVRIHYLDEHRTQLRFLPGIDQQQGRIELRMPLTISSEKASLKGPLAAILKLNRMDVSFNYDRQFTPAITTSDRRSLDLAANKTYAQLDSVGGVTVTSREADVETVRRYLPETGSHITITTPSAIAARPVDPGELRLGRVRMDTELSKGAGTVFDIFMVVVTLGLAFLFLWSIMWMIALVSLTLALVGLGLIALIGIAVGLGLGRWLRRLARRSLTDYVSKRARAELSRPESLALIRAGLDDAGMMTYAGEGLSEAIAIMAVRQAIADGHSIEAPDETGRGSGRERFRDQVFETIAVGEGVCRVQLRVP